jgi:hypothetical protein
MTRWYLRDIISDPTARIEIQKALSSMGPIEVPPLVFDVPQTVAVQRDSYTFRVPDLTGDVQAGAHAAVLELIATHRALRADLAARLVAATSDVGKTYLIYILGQAAIEQPSPAPIVPFTDVKGSAQRWDSARACCPAVAGLTSVRAIRKRPPTETVELRR